MDVYCPKCAEPVEIDYFHDVADDQGTSFDEVRSAFFSEGCSALGSGAKCAPVRNQRQAFRAEATAALADVLGDDIDGLAAMLDDFEYLGML